MFILCRLKVRGATEMHRVCDEARYIYKQYEGFQKIKERKDALIMNEIYKSNCDSYLLNYGNIKFSKFDS